MKKILISLVLLLIGLTAMAQSATPTWSFMPLISGWNVLIPTNSTATAVGYGTTNILYTTLQGQIVYSLTNNYVNGGYLSSNTFPDAFTIVPLSPDANGDIVANASLVVSVGNTNFIPIAVTNAVGQYIVTNWLLAASQFPDWQYPATTNLYPASIGSGTSTNTITVNLYRVFAKNFGAGSGTSITPLLADATPGYTVTLNGGGVNGNTVCSNLPTSFLTGARFVYITVASSVSGNAGGTLINQCGLLQPQP